MEIIYFLYWSTVKYILKIFNELYRFVNNLIILLHLYLLDWLLLLLLISDGDLYERNRIVLRFGFHVHFAPHPKHSLSPIHSPHRRVVHVLQLMDPCFVWLFSHSVMSDSLRPHGLQPTRLLRPRDCPGKSTGVGCHCLL